VHKLIEWSLRLEIDQDPGPRPVANLESEISFTAYERWRSTVNLEPLEVEKTVFHSGLGYAGTMDLLARINGEIAVVDFKTSRSLYEEYDLQVAAYGMALDDMWEGPVSRGYIVRIPKTPDDSFQVKEIDGFDEPFAVFCHVLEVWRWKDKNFRAWLARKMRGEV
jgi:predicted RecB family nuclease